MAFRGAASVRQTNFGMQSPSQVSENLDRSPGKKTTKFRAKNDEARSKKSEKSDFNNEMRLLVAKKTGLWTKIASIQRRKVIPYKSNSGVDGVSELLWDKPDGEVLTDWTESKIVIFDLETSGFSLTAEICQISAATETETFNVYMVPTSMTFGAAKITGLEIRAGEMYLNDKQLDTVPPRDGLVRFIEFLRKIGNSIILVAHNGFRFDAPIILRTMRNFELLEEFVSVAKGFADTLPIFRDLLVERRQEEKKFSLAALAMDFFGPSAIEGRHDAQVDIRILRQLIIIIGIEDEAIKAETKSTQDILRYLENKDALLPLKPGVSAGMITKIAKAGISLNVLRKKYFYGGENAVKMVLAEDVGGRPRVTKNRKVIKKVIETLQELQG